MTNISSNSLQINPVLLIVFNRPEGVSKIVDVLRRLKVERLYVAADAPRDGNDDDVIKCKQVLNIFNEIDWPCSIKYKINEVNRGSWLTIPMAVDWFFANEPQGIVLEDDCIPSVSFFRFCDVMLKRYEDDPHIMWINGSNLGWNSNKEMGDYFYSRFAISWGWATWRRSWKMFESYRYGSPGRRKTRMIIREMFPKSWMQRCYWGSVFRYAYSLQNWDFRWQLAMWAAGGLSCTPKFNQISNVGFDNTGVHGGNVFDPRGNIKVFDLPDVIKSPKVICKNEELDKYLSNFLYRVSFFGIIKMEIARKFPSIRPLYKKVQRFLNSKKD